MTERARTADHWNALLHPPFDLMKRSNDAFVLVNANSPKKRRQKWPINHRKLLCFDSAPSGSGSLNSLEAHDENTPSPILRSPWIPLSRFKSWNPSKVQSNGDPRPASKSVSAPACLEFPTSGLPMYNIPLLFPTAFRFDIHHCL